MDQELPDVQTGFRKGRGTRDQIANILWIIEKAREFQKSTDFCFIDCDKPLTVWVTTNWKIIKVMRIPAHLTCLLWNLYIGQEATKLDMEQWTGSKLGKECQGCTWSPWLFNLYAEYITWNSRLDEAHAGIKISGRNIITSDMQMTPPLWQKVKRN